jgi:hypothetical protein
MLDSKGPSRGSQRFRKPVVRQSTVKTGDGIELDE